MVKQRNKQAMINIKKHFEKTAKLLHDLNAKVKELEKNKQRT